MPLMQNDPLSNALFHQRLQDQPVHPGSHCPGSYDKTLQDSYSCRPSAVTVSDVPVQPVKAGQDQEKFQGLLYRLVPPPAAFPFLLYCVVRDPSQSDRWCRPSDLR